MIHEAWAHGKNKVFLNWRSSPGVAQLELSWIHLFFFFSHVIKLGWDLGSSCHVSVNFKHSHSPTRATVDTHTASWHAVCIHLIKTKTSARLCPGPPNTSFLTAVLNSLFFFSYWSLSGAGSQKVLTGHYCTQITLNFHHLTKMKLVVSLFLLAVRDQPVKLWPPAALRTLYSVSIVLGYGRLPETVWLWKMCEDVMRRMAGSRTAVSCRCVCVSAAWCIIKFWTRMPFFISDHCTFKECWTFFFY